MNRGDAYRQCLDEGLSVAETAARLGVSRPSARAWAKRRGLKFRSVRAEHVAAHVTVYRQCLAEGLDVRATAARAGVKPAVVYAWARRAGVRFNSIPRQRDKLLQGYAAQGLTVRQAAARTGLSRLSVRAWVQKTGVRFAHDTPLRKRIDVVPTEQQIADYKEMRRAGCPMDEAITGVFGEVR